jgi:uncharacterized membrane protein (DUF2068 family)
MSAHYALKLKRMNATPIGFERASESYGRWSVRHKNENTCSAASIGNGFTVRQSSPLFLKLLAIYYLVQGFLLIAVGVGGLILVDQNQILVIKQWLRVIRLDPENHFINWLLTKILPVTNEMLEALSIGSFVYGGLAFAQGGGLWFSKPWASYLSLVVVGSFIPWQLYSMLDEVTALKLITLCINSVIVGYLLVSVLRARGAKRNDCAGGTSHK